MTEGTDVRAGKPTTDVDKRGLIEVVETEEGADVDITVALVVVHVVDVRRVEVRVVGDAVVVVVVALLPDSVVVSSFFLRLAFMIDAVVVGRVEEAIVVDAAIFLGLVVINIRFIKSFQPFSTLF